METLLLISIVILQNIAVFLDNYAVFYLTSNHSSSKIASIYTKKFQIDFLSRGFLFFTPPLLGFMLTENNLYLLLLSLLISGSVTFFLTIFQAKKFLKKMKFRFSFKILQGNIILILIGLIVYASYLYVPFYLNIISYFFKESSLWIVQSSPLLTAVSTIFVVYYMDPKIAKFIDDSNRSKNPTVLFELIAIRAIGRFIILLISCFLFVELL